MLSIIVVILYYIRVIRQCHKYDPTTGRWRECATLKKGRCCHDATAFNNRIFVSGTKNHTTSSFSSCLCPYALAVKGKANKRGNTVIALYFTSGGETQSGEMLPLVESYEPLTNEWHREEPLLNPRKDHACVATQDALYLLGGQSKTEPFSDHIW